MKFAFLENLETFNFLSKISGREQIYYQKDIGNSDVEMISLGRLKDWVTGSVEVSQDSTLENSVFPVQVFTFTHELIINPWYTLDLVEFLDNNTIPDFLNGESSFKYAFEVELRKQLTDLRTSKSKTLKAVMRLRRSRLSINEVKLAMILFVVKVGH